jgi:sugar lactone lactonase YvrE
MNELKRTFAFGSDVAGPPAISTIAYLSGRQVCVQDRFRHARRYCGGDLGTGKAWKVLSGDPSTQFEKDVTVMVHGKPLRRPDNRQPMFNADGIALSPDGKILYCQALTGKTLYKIGTDVLQAAGEKPDGAKAEKVATTEPVDGLWTDKAQKLFLSSIGDNAVKSLNPDGTFANRIN